MKDSKLKKILVWSTLLITVLSLAIVFKKQRGTALLALYLPGIFLAVADIVIGKLREPKDRGDQVGKIEIWDPMLIRRKTAKKFSVVGLVILAVSIAMNFAQGESFAATLPLIVLAAVCLDGAIRSARPIKIYKNGLQMENFVKWENIEIGERYRGEVVVRYRLSRVLVGVCKVRIGKGIENIRELKEREA